MDFEMAHPSVSKDPAPHMLACGGRKPPTSRLASKVQLHNPRHPQSERSPSGSKKQGRHLVRAHLSQLSEEAKQAKVRLLEELAGVKDFGVYGVKAAKLADLKSRILELESANPLQEPTKHLNVLAGTWIVLFSTIKITGWKRVTLGLRDIVQIDGLTQEVEETSGIAVNRVAFSVPAFRVKDGELILKAAYQVKSEERVSITLSEARLVPERLQRVFENNFDLLLSIFNPEGWLDITYCDQELRCGRDDKGNIYVLQRVQR